MKCSLGVCDFFEEISVVFPILLFSSISLYRSLRKAFLPLLAILWNSASNGYIFIDLENKLMVARGKDGRKE